MKYWCTRSLLHVALLIGGCATVDRRAGFADVERSVNERIDKRVVWRQETNEDDELEHAIKTLIQDELSADEAVQIALLSNHSLQSTYEELGIAQADLVQAGLLQNPVFEAQFRFPGRPTNPYELHIVQDFIDIFFIPLRRKAASAAFEAAKFEVANAVLEVAAETRRSFYRLQGAEQLADMRKTVVEATAASALLAERQHKAGNISDLDLANEQALAEQSKIDFALSEIDALEQRERLNELMGLAGDEAGAWTISSRLPEALSSETTSDQWESLAILQRLDLLAARREIESLAHSLGLARSSALIPSLEIGAHVEREPDGPATWGPSVGLPLPVFSQGQPTITRATAKLRQSQQKYLALAVKVQTEVRSAQNRMSAARRLAEHYKSAMLPLREKIVEESQLHYNAMQIGPFQLLQAKQAELEAGGRYIEALENYWVARADLERAVGGRLDAAPQIESETKEAETPSHEHSTTHGGH